MSSNIDIVVISLLNILKILVGDRSVLSPGRVFLVSELNGDLSIIISGVQIIVNITVD